ncbi:class A beta-lactamase [Jiella sonneratiae]|nr:class A beta-lactamase [Jiella sonneratiae]
MRIIASVMPPVAAWLALGLFIATSARAETPESRLEAVVARVEKTLDARVGVALTDTGADRTWTHRANERFLMNSTVKAAICGTALWQSEEGRLDLADELAVRAADILDYAPVTETKVGGKMAIDDLCLAALDMSDNTAANLLVRRLGGPKVVTAFMRRLDDEVSRLDRLEPELNTFSPGDPRDTTTPAAMAAQWQEMLLGDTLNEASRKRLADWMSHGGVTKALLRRNVPDGWSVSDKSGAGDHTRNLVAMVTPPNRAPWIVAIFISDGNADFATRNAALQEIGAAAMALVAAP